MSKKENTIGQEFEDFLRFALTEHLKPDFAKKEDDCKELVPHQVIRKFCESHGITEDIFRGMCISQKMDTNDMEAMLQALFHPTTEDIEWENSDDYKSVLKDPSSFISDSAKI